MAGKGPPGGQGHQRGPGGHQGCPRAGAGEVPLPVERAWRGARSLHISAGPSAGQRGGGQALPAAGVLQPAVPGAQELPEGTVGGCRRPARFSGWRGERVRRQGATPPGEGIRHVIAESFPLPVLLRAGGDDRRPRSPLPPSALTSPPLCLPGDGSISARVSTARPLATARCLALLQPRAWARVSLASK